jgi:4-hydroxy-tetrahydrodipicolinate reductase
MEPIKVVVHGAAGRMGRQVVSAVCGEADLTPVGAADTVLEPGSYPLPDGSGSVPQSNALQDVVDGADVVVDFSVADATMKAMRVASAHKVNVVVGTTGITDANLEEADSLAREHDVGIIVAPNFAMGGVLMIHLARVAARFFDYADLTEMHHEAKIDAPSGTALAIARAAVDGKGGGFTSPAAEKETLAGTRGGVYQGVNVHSARMPGRMAHHELVFGALGQTLTIRHDSINREGFMPGVVMAIRQAVKSKGLTVGLENIMGL